MEVETAPPEMRPAPAEANAAAAASAVPGRRTARLGVLREGGIVLAFVVVFVFLAVDSPQFLTGHNLLNIVYQQTSIGLIACAGTLVMIAGGFDLSVGAIFAFCGVIAAKASISLGPIEGLALAVVAGAAVGCLNGLIVARWRINPLIATLASSTVIGGVTLVVTNGFLVNVNSSTFGAIGSDKLLGVYWSAWILLAFALAMGFLLSRTSFGRHVFATGGNEEAASLSGVRVAAVRTVTYGLSGLACGIAAMLYTSHVQSAEPTAGASYALTAIAAVVVGGTSIGGGEGAIWRTAVGVLLLGMIADGFDLLALNPLYQQIVQGVIILAAVGLDVLAKRNRR